MLKKPALFRRAWWYCRENLVSVLFSQQQENQIQFSVTKKLWRWIPDVYIGFWYQLCTWSSCTELCKTQTHTHTHTVTPNVKLYRITLGEEQRKITSLTRVQELGAGLFYGSWSFYNLSDVSFSLRKMIWNCKCKSKIKYKSEFFFRMIKRNQMSNFIKLENTTNANKSPKTNSWHSYNIFLLFLYLWGGGRVFNHNVLHILKVAVKLGEKLYHISFTSGCKISGISNVCLCSN